MLLPTEISAAGRKGRCRVCGQAFFPAPLLCYNNMPGAAQAFPTAATLALDQGSNLEVVQCSACGLIQLDCPPVPYYREVIRAAAFSPEMREFRLAQFRTWIQKYGLAGKKILEIGCGRGEYLALLNECGVAAHGLEYSQASVQSCRAQGLAVTRGFVERRSQWLRGAPFDAFVSLNFLEHWPRPVASLQGIRENLAEDGLGLVEVPNFDMILNLGLYSEFISDHLSYFTRDTLATTLQYSGFEILECDAVWHDYILSAVVRKRRPTDFSLIRQRHGEIADALRAFIGRFPAGKVAVWGAGHQALAVIALAGLGGSIRYVVDSAPFKQGKYTPATHLPIVPPETLERDPVDAVIVMAASYSDEVAAIVRSRYGERLQVAILRDHGLEMG